MASSRNQSNVHKATVVLIVIHFSLIVLFALLVDVLTRKKYLKAALHSTNVSTGTIAV